MRQFVFPVLLAVAPLVSVGEAAGTGSPRGVGPDFAKHYQAKDTFICINHPSIKLSATQINDNSCDCPDGSDEPGTAACAPLNSLSPPQPLPGSASGTTNTTNALPGFWCANSGHVGSYIPFAYINDGVCDYELCCDGSDEYAGVGGVKCENRCKEIGKEQRRIEDERRKTKERAAKNRRALAKDSQTALRQLEAKISSSKQEIKFLERKRDDLQKKFNEAEEQDRGRVTHDTGAGGKLGVLVGLAKTRVDELRGLLTRVLAHRERLKQRVSQLEEILTKFKEEYNPNFNDEGVKSAVKAWEDYAATLYGDAFLEVPEEDIEAVRKEDDETNGINWKEFEEDESTDTDILYTLEAYLPESLKNFVHEKIEALRLYLIQNGILADKTKPGSESRIVKAARDALEAANKELLEKQTSLNNNENEFEKDYGPDDIFRALKGKCATLDSHEYTYELCWFDKTSQKNKKGHGNTNMGYFTQLDYEHSDEEERADGKGLGTGKRMVLRYENGQVCWGGPARRTDVWLACSETEEVWRVSEAEKCVYRMEVGTPAACDETEDVKGKDEL